MHLVGVMAGSKAGMVARIVSHHAAGAGGLRHSEGSDRSPECAGMTSVPSAPSARSNARITATGPPQTQPRALSEECQDDHLLT